MGESFQRVWANHFNASAELRLWDGADGSIDGFVFYLASENNPEFFLRPELYDTAMAEEMVTWAMEQAQADGLAFLDTSCTARDTRKAAFLQRAGFQRIDDDVMVFMERRLDAPLPEYQLPPGYAIVSQQEHPDLTSVTGRPMTPTQYGYLYNAPGYKDDLGLRVCYRDAEIVSGCICWYDEVDNCGLFEPVGTSAEHRGKGLAFAVMAKTIENLQRYDADRVYIRTTKENTPAVRLYEKLGFRVTDEDYGWRREI